jgi:hypothetical protein
MKWYAPYGSSSEKRLLGTRNFPALRLCNRSHLPHQKDGFNCGVGVGACAGIAIVLRNFLQKEDNVSWFDTRPRRGKDSMVFLKDKMTQEVYLLFPDDFFESVPTKDDLVWGNYLDCLREEWFVLFDPLAHLQFITLPQQINRDNAVDPVYHTMMKAISWPHKEERANRGKVPRKKALAKMARIETGSSEVGSSVIGGSSSLAQVSQTQDSADVELESINAALNTTTDDDAINESNNDKEFIEQGLLTSGDGTSSTRYTKAFITDPAKLKPVRIHMTIKKRKGDLLERLKLSRVKLSDDEYDAIDAVDDPESPYYYEVDETGKKQKFSTQSTKLVKAFWQKYHTNLEDDDEVQAITPEFTKALDDFIAKSFAKWKWSSDKDHKAEIKEWADKMKQKVCSKEKRTVERAHFTSQFTNEFMFTRPTMVKGLRYANENNSLYARIVYQEIDKKNSA